MRTRSQVEQLADPQAVVAEILKRCPAKQLMVLYKVPAFQDATDFLQHVAFRRGRLLPGGIGDAQSAARVVLHDWHNGKLGYYTQPPKRGDGSHEEAAVVDAWGEAFDADKVGHTGAALLQVFARACCAESRVRCRQGGALALLSRRFLHGHVVQKFSPLQLSDHRTQLSSALPKRRELNASDDPPSRLFA